MPPRRQIVAGAVVGAVVAGLALAAAASAEKVEKLEIVDRSIEHHGGALFDNVEVSLTVSSLSGAFHIVSHRRGGLFDYRVERTREGVTKSWRHSNDAVEVRESGTSVSLDARERARAKDFVSARLYFSLMPSRLNDPNTYKEDLGLETWDGRQLRRVKVSFTPGTSTHAEDQYLYWFDPSSGRLEQFAYSFSSGSGGLRFRRLFNYRRIGGILFADQTNLAIDGPGLSVDLIAPSFVEKRMKELSTVEFTDIEVNPLGS